MFEALFPVWYSSYKHLYPLISNKGKGSL